MIECSTDSIQGDLNDKTSLHAAIKGSWGVFSVTNFWEVFSADAEETQGKNVADVCKVRCTVVVVMMMMMLLLQGTADSMLTGR